MSKEGRENVAFRDVLEAKLYGGLEDLDSAELCDLSGKHEFLSH